jgi:hypothetical protein
MKSSLSKRLHTENPFEEFHKAVEKAVLKKQGDKKKIFEPDMNFYRP